MALCPVAPRSRAVPWRMRGLRSILALTLPGTNPPHPATRAKKMSQDFTDHPRQNCCVHSGSFLLWPFWKPTRSLTCGHRITQSTGQITKQLLPTETLVFPFPLLLDSRSPLAEEALCSELRCHVRKYPGPLLQLHVLAPVAWGGSRRSWGP